MKNIIQTVQEKPWVGWLLFCATVGVVFLVGMFANTVMERRGEEKTLFQMVKPIADWEPRNEVWGENFPREYETYMSTKDTSFRSKHGGSATRDILAEYPNVVILFAGYAFSKDFKQARGHYYAVEDIRKTLRTGAPQPGTCWTCKSTDVPRVMNERGAPNFYKEKWDNLGHEIVNPIGCQDCHDPKTMNLRITRPALAEAFKRRGMEVEKSNHQDMRSLVCAQCHVEYYFKGKEDKYLTFPWDKGFTAEQMESYYDSVQHVDWVHAVSKAPMLKAQHPDYEIFKTGIHAERGVSCADCHMPYRSQGGVKFTDHKIQSPLNNIAGSCQVCHRESEETLRKNVNDRQDKVIEVRSRLEEVLAKAHIEAKTAWEKGATEHEMKPALQLIRQAQWRWDYVAASHGGSFHAPLEAARVLGAGIQKAQEARIILSQVLMAKGVAWPITMPDITTKEKAQAFIGLDMAKLKTAKDEFIKNILPEWDKKAAERQAKMGTKIE
ncbi:MAG TPA: ammonia-forming cytochrome c nitrite reductase [bacterium]|nr:ammonia-forming cytochrome c nitrite reductase [bacterium]HMW31997.1 ammonia-forming cytochrome c nitrite reductase [bacterium]HMY36265.1 ammonia-forming cytochrome c nitrite reductase [bacterium]HNB10102.1 ammonia-forming cytochrome c nitrite reductase [bacterium]HNB57673.1 ammonia-forming cytochrome c nitrite reductase [bacterium]